MYTLNCKGRLLAIEKPVVMGILNITPDSFYKGSRVVTLDAIAEQAGNMLEAGATILDIGGQSTRPGSERITAKEEAARVLPAMEAVRRQFPDAFLSIDTFYADVARDAVSAGADIVNDISAGSIDPGMISTVAQLNVPYVLMHMKGTPQTMQQEAGYTNVTTEVLDFLLQQQVNLQQQGIRDIVIDPGFGFGKTITHNFSLLKNLEVFQLLKAPLLLGISRKSFIWKTLNCTPADALNGTTALHSIGLEKGAAILRVHDVKEAVETISLYEALQLAP
ncbi:MAG: dihydropteroate synthase [Bacteroidetes bacterium]|nr:dihydropteroate synthase [Bacteroidota bacterium]